MEIGAQLYTIRNFCKTKEDYAESLSKIADIGYKNVQISGGCEVEPQWLLNELNKNGLKCVVTHCNKIKLQNEPLSIVEEHNVLGCDYIGLGYFPFEDVAEALKLFDEKYSGAAKTLKENGKFFMYHNHACEFNKLDGKTFLEHIADKYSKEELGFILDTYWVQTAGGDPAWWLEKLSGRVPCIHLKDHTFDRKMAVLGEGNINFNRVFEKAEAGGTKYMLVEQDDCNGEDPFDCLKRSYEYLKARGFK